MTAEPGVIIIDIPEGTTPEEASRLINTPGDSYFLVQVLPIGGAHRAYLRRYKQAPAKAQTETTSATADDVTALSVVRANRDKPLRTIVSLLDAAGVKRGRQWVCDQLTATCAEDGREDEALAFLKDHSHYEPRDIADELRYPPLKIKRSIAWVRQKRKELEALSARTNLKADRTSAPIVLTDES